MLVLLVHGLGRTPLSLFGLAAALRRAGHHTRFFGYSPTFETLPLIINRLTNRLRALARSRKPVGLVGHSLGGLLLRLALGRVPELSVHRFVMLGTPNRGSLMARLASRWFPFRFFAQNCGRLLATDNEFERLRDRMSPSSRLPAPAAMRAIQPVWARGERRLVSVSEASVEDEPLLNSQRFTRSSWMPICPLACSTHSRRDPTPLENCGDARSVVKPD